MTTKKSQFTALSVLKSIPQGKIIISILIGLMQSALSILWPILIYKNIKQLSELSFSNIILDITLIIISTILQKTKIAPLKKLSC